MRQYSPYERIRRSYGEYCLIHVGYRQSLVTIAGLTHWSRMTHICVGKLSIIGSDNDLSPGWRQSIIWTNAGIFLIRPLGTNFSEIWIETETFSVKEMHLKMASIGLGLNELNLSIIGYIMVWRSHSFISALHYPIFIIVQVCLKASTI